MPALELKLLLGREMHALPSNLIAMKFVGHKIGRGRNRRKWEQGIANSREEARRGRRGSNA